MVGPHLVARYTGLPLFALDLAIAPIWAHSFLVLFTVLPTFIFGFLFTTFPRWMNGPRCRATPTSPRPRCWSPRRSPGSPACTRRPRCSSRRRAVRCAAWSSGWSHCCGCSSTPAGRVARGRRANALCGRHRLARRLRLRPVHRRRLCAALRGALRALGLPVAGVLRRLPPDDSVLFAERRSRLRGLASAVDTGRGRRPRLRATAARNRRRPRFAAVRRRRARRCSTATCAVRWTSLGARGNPLLWTLYAGLRVAAGRDGAAGGARRRVRADRGVGARSRTDPRARHRVLRRHAGRDGHARDDGALRPPAAHGPRTLACFAGVQLAAVARVGERDRDGARRDRESCCSAAWRCGCWRSASGVVASRAASTSRPRRDGKPG